MSQPGFTQVSGTRVLDATGQVLVSGAISFTPILDNGSVTSFQIGGTLHGQALGIPVYARVTNGAFSVQLADTTQTNPVNISYLVCVTDDSTGNAVLQGSGYRIQPSGSTWSFDYFIPTLTPQLGYIVSKGDRGDTGSPGNFGPTVKTATQLGCTADGTDCAPILNSFFANASASNPRVLLLDTPGLISISGITLSANGYCSIVGMGDSTGFFLLNGAYADAIALGYNATNVPPQPTPTIVASSVLLRDFRLDGNRAGQHGNWNGTWTFGININTCSDVRIENVTVVHPSTYGIMLGNVARASVCGCRLMSFLDTETVVASNTDGIHVNGPAHDVIISDCHFRCGDDSIALNCPEGYSGSIERVAISNCTVNQSQTFCRLYSNSATADTTGLLNAVTISNVTGSVNVVGFVIGIETPHTPSHLDAIRNIAIQNVHLSGPRWMLASDHIGSMTWSDCTWAESTGSCGMFQAWGQPITVSNLAIRNCRILRDSLGPTQLCVVDTVTMTAGQAVAFLHLDITNFGIEDLGSGTTPHDYPQIALLNLSPTTTVQRLTTTGLSVLFYTVLTVNGAGVSVADYTRTFLSQSITSTDLLHMIGVPDAVVYLGSMYYSLDHGNVLSINNNGVRATLGVTAH